MCVCVCVSLCWTIAQFAGTTPIPSVTTICEGEGGEEREEERVGKGRGEGRRGRRGEFRRSRRGGCEGNGWIHVVKSKAEAIPLCM